MIIEYNLKNLETLCDDFFNATGINLMILDSSLKVLHFNREYNNKYCKLIQSIPKGMQACKKSDENLLLKCKQTKAPVQHTCRAGLVDIALPISIDKEIIGYIVLGQIKVDVNFDKSKFFKEELKIIDQLKSEYDSIPKSLKSKILSTLNIASILAKHLLVENIIKVKKNKRLENVIKYINDNINKNLSIKTITENTYESKSSLYLLFKQSFKMTIGEYINNERIKKATELIQTTNFDMERISIEVGFSSQSYFSKTFKRIKGVSPMQFRKNLK